MTASQAAGWAVIGTVGGWVAAVATADTVPQWLIDLAGYVLAGILIGGAAVGVWTAVWMVWAFRRALRRASRQVVSHDPPSLVELLPQADRCQHVSPHYGVRCGRPVGHEDHHGVVLAEGPILAWWGDDLDRVTAS